MTNQNCDKEYEAAQAVVTKDYEKIVEVVKPRQVLCVIRSVVLCSIFKH